MKRLCIDCSTRLVGHGKWGEARTKENPVVMAECERCKRKKATLFVGKPKRPSTVESHIDQVAIEKLDIHPYAEEGATQHPYAPPQVQPQKRRNTKRNIALAIGAIPMVIAFLISLVGIVVILIDRPWAGVCTIGFVCVVFYSLTLWRWGMNQEPYV
jgi:hypothetical protein